MKTIAIAMPKGFCQRRDVWDIMKQVHEHCQSKKIGMSFEGMFGDTCTIEASDRNATKAARYMVNNYGGVIEE